MKIDNLIEKLKQARSVVGNVDVSYVDMRFGNAPLVWEHTREVVTTTDKTCYIEIQGETDPKYGNVDALGRKV
jgi:hypothetical protein